VSLDRLWAGWRASYIDSVVTKPPGDDCVICGLAAAPPDDAQVVARGERAFVVLNAYPYSSGHLMVAPLRHEGELDLLTDDEATELMRLTRTATRAVKLAYGPDGMNVGINLGRAGGAGVPGHLHVHVLPRWFGDTNFMTTVAETRVLPEPLSATLERVRAVWPEAAAPAGEA
jgi:ATP adenylyltransferase